MPNPSDFSVLVVDDEQDVLTFLSAVLEEAGFRVSTATNGKDALAMVKKERPDFISLDLVMPGGTGIAFLHELRRNREWINIPVMVVTGHGRDDLGRADLDQALEGKLLSGPRVYLEKPVTEESYLAAVFETLGIENSAPAPDGQESSLRQQVAEDLKGASKEQLTEILTLLNRRAHSRD
jgi:CheY-like chemotaxis protein